MIHLAVIFDSLAIIALALALWKEISDNKSHWKATKHELEQAWESINELEGVDPAEVGNPKSCIVSDEELEKIRAEK